jgi:1-acyl-sn-glycerol-3-phosphate acyltransferase
VSKRWESPTPIAFEAIGVGGYARAAVRGAAIGVVLGVGLLLMLPLRRFERLRHGAARPWSPRITQVVCRWTLWLVGIGFARTGRPSQKAGVVVANHSSWLDIFALNAGQQVCFVAKSEVASWPGIGVLARVTGTVFVRRDKRAAAEQIATFRERIATGHRLLFFPEGTSTDGKRVLDFKSTLFDAFLRPDIKMDLLIQPVTVAYEAPAGRDRRFYGWWGAMDFAPHLFQVLACYPQGCLHVIYHPPVSVSEFADRKKLAAHLAETVRDSLAECLGEAFEG